MFTNLGSGNHREDHFCQIAGDKRNDARHQRSFPVHASLVGEPDRAEGVGNYRAANHAQEADKALGNKFVNEESGNQRHGKEAD